MKNMRVFLVILLAAFGFGLTFVGCQPSTDTQSDGMKNMPSPNSDSMAVPEGQIPTEEENMGMGSQADHANMPGMSNEDMTSPSAPMQQTPVMMPATTPTPLATPAPAATATPAM